jgi:hypothetical protein
MQDEPGLKIFEGSKWGFNFSAMHCPSCKERMPNARMPEDLHQMMWGGWTCPKCGCRMDKWGKAVEGADGEPS